MSHPNEIYVYKGRFIGNPLSGGFTGTKEWETDGRGKRKRESMHSENMKGKREGDRGRVRTVSEFSKHWRSPVIFKLTGSHLMCDF